MIKGFFGVNIAVNDLEAATAKYEALLGVPAQQAKSEDFAFPGIVGVGFEFHGVLISLLSSKDQGNPVGAFLKKKGEGIILISVKADDIENDIEALRKKGLSFLMPEVFSGPFGKVNFIPPKTMHGVQVEVIQPAGRLEGGR
ncbi:MAG: VOC family protein [Thermodesulfobacteriota bacterium]